MKTYYSDPTANAVIAKISREEARAEKRRRRKDVHVWRPDSAKKADKK